MQAPDGFRHRISTPKFASAFPPPKPTKAPKLAVRQPPPFVTPSKAPVRLLKPLAAPSLPAQPTTRPQLRPIIARQDPNFLLEQQPTTPSYPDRERGVDISPEKRENSKTKFLRSGMAAQASDYFQRSKTSLVLWRHESSHRRPSTSAADLQVHILKIIQHPKLPSSKQRTHPGIAVCKNQQTMKFQTIIFQFGPNAESDVGKFREGSWAEIKMPWHNARLSQALQLHRQPRPLPSLSPALTFCDPTLADALTDVLICSKFLLPS